MTTEACQATLSPRPFPDAPPGPLIRLALCVRQVLLHLANRLVPAEVVLHDHGAGLVGTALLGAIARLRVADLIGDGALTAADLALLTGAHPDRLHRTLRALATKGVFTLLPDGRFRNNRLSAPLRAQNLRQTPAWIRYFASPANVASWADFDRTLMTGDSAFARVHGQGIWDHFDSHPDQRRQFALAMMGLTVHDAPVVARGYPFREIRRVCDVGGGSGILLSELLIRHGHLTGVLCDRPGVMAEARAVLADRGIAERVTLAPGDFCEAVPAGCDAYLLKHILHDWDDATCIRILQSCRRAMTGTARLLIIETPTETHEATGFGPLSDLQMMVACDNGRERSRAEYARLLTAADFRLTGTHALPTFSILEARPMAGGAGR